jgi:hypothetical protein
MIARASFAMSTADILWLSPGRPVEFWKWLCDMPSRFAYWFISAAKVSSVPATASASAIVASLPLCTIMPWIRTSTGTWLPRSRNVREPSERQARSLTGTAVSSLSLPSFSEWNTA